MTKMDGSFDGLLAERVPCTGVLYALAIVDGEIFSFAVEC